jgi:hypothetical protein
LGSIAPLSLQPQVAAAEPNLRNNKISAISSSLIGSFKDGRGELFQQNTFNNRSILVRGLWSDITPTAHNYTESYSDDGGRTWKPAFIAHLTRENQSGATPR